MSGTEQLAPDVQAQPNTRNMRRTYRRCYISTLWLLLNALGLKREKRSGWSRRARASHSPATNNG